MSVYGHSLPSTRLCLACREVERAEAAQKRGETLLIQARVPAHYRGTSFATFSPRTGTETAYRLAMQWSKELRQGAKPRRGLLFQGPPGSGKTHLSASILREFVFATFMPALFLNVPEWLNQMRTAIQSGEVSTVASPRGPRLLVIDDVGAERSTPWSAEHLYSLVSHREANRLPTVTSTNLSDAELAGRLGKATLSRLTALCMKVPLMPTSDYRAEAAADEART